MTTRIANIRWFESLGSGDVQEVGGKNASLGEMFSSLKPEGILVPDGFATTAFAYRAFLEENCMSDEIARQLADMKTGVTTLSSAGRNIRQMFSRAEFPKDLEEDIREAYRELGRRYGVDEVSVAVRSSATAEDLPEASFAGQQESFLNVAGEEHVLEACKLCFASLFTDRAISYREEMGFEHLKVALSVGVQKMVRSDRAGAGVMFTLDPETGFPDVVVINAAWGLGEIVVQGSVNPDEYQVFKPLIGREGYAPIIEKLRGDKHEKIIYAGKGGSRTTQKVRTSRRERSSFVLGDDEIMQLATWACEIERHYGMPMDIEWAKDGESGQIFIVQARPETVQSQREASFLKSYQLKEPGKLLLRGLSIGEAIATGQACVIERAHDIENFVEGSILVTGMTDPDWVPIMKRAAGIVTDHGGRTSHAAIVSRELGLPAIVGTGHATEILRDGQAITMSCAEGDEGHVYEGILAFETTEINTDALPETKTLIMMNNADPAAAFSWWRLPVSGVGLARMEFIVDNIIKVHPMALAHYDDLDDDDARTIIEELTAGYEDKTDYFVEKLALGIGKLAAAHYPHPVIVRMSDFKTNEYANLIGGRQFEPEEENPMLGFRGASRYYSANYRDGFALECRAIKRVREEIGMANVIVMIPFCRTPAEADRVLDVMAANGLKRGENGLRVYVMCEIPSNVVLAEEFAKRVDGFSIGSNDLTQLVLGVDRDSTELAPLFDERDEAVKRMIAEVIRKAHASGKKVGICGEAPSNYPEFAEFLVGEGIDSMSLSPDSVINTIHVVAAAEKAREGA